MDRKLVYNWVYNEQNTFSNALWNLFVVAIVIGVAIVADAFRDHILILDILICNIAIHAVTWKRRRYYIPHCERCHDIFTFIYNVKCKRKCGRVRVRVIREYNFSMVCYDNKYSVCVCYVWRQTWKERKYRWKTQPIFFSLFFLYHSSWIVGCHRCGCIKLCQHQKWNIIFILFLVLSPSYTHIYTSHKHTRFDKWSRFVFVLRYTETECKWVSLLFGIY